MSDRPRVLFLCTGNSCRSQMAEGLLRHLAGDRLEALSAGVLPVGVNPGAVNAMAEIGVDISAQESEHVSEYLADPPDLVVAVCDGAAAVCPEFPGPSEMLRWPFDDPVGSSGSPQEAAEFGRVRDEIRARLEAWLREGAPPLALGG